MTLCGGEDRGEDTCAGKHKVKTLKCGHEGCNFNEPDDDEECLSCPKEAKEKDENDAIEKDKVLIKSMIEKASSDSFKQHLEEFLKERTRSASSRKGVLESWSFR
jgi:hypothetical protein